MTPTAPNVFARSEFHQTDARIRDNVAIVGDEQEMAMIRLEAEVGAAARRLREANRSGTMIITRGQHEGARASISDEPAHHSAAESYRDVRQAASDADRIQRHQQLAARGAALLAEIEANRPAILPIEPELAPHSLFSR